VSDARELEEVFALVAVGGVARHVGGLAPTGLMAYTSRWVCLFPEGAF
jgi:hypothetical protein